MPLIRHRPFPRTDLQQQVNRLLDQFHSEFGAGSQSLGGGMFTPAVDVKENLDAYVVQMEIPGVAIGNLEITMQDNVLGIRGSKEQKSDQADHQQSGQNEDLDDRG